MTALSITMALILLAIFAFGAWLRWGLLDHQRRDPRKPYQEDDDE